MKNALLSVIVLLASVCYSQVTTKTLVAVAPTAAGAVASPSVALSCTPATIGAVANGFNFYRSLSSTMSTPILLNATPQATCAFTDTTVSFSTTYFYAATAVNTSACPVGKVCESAFSNSAQAVIQANPIPNAPVLGTPTVNVASVQLKWSETGTYAAFRVYRKKSVTTSWNQIASGLTLPTFTDRTGVPRVRYDYGVRAVNRVNGAAYLSAMSNVQQAVYP